MSTLVEPSLPLRDQLRTEEERHAEFVAARDANLARIEAERPVAEFALREAEEEYVTVRDAFAQALNAAISTCRETVEARQVYVRAWDRARRVGVETPRIPPMRDLPGLWNLTRGEV